MTSRDNANGDRIPTITLEPVIQDAAASGSTVIVLKDHVLVSIVFWLSERTRCLDVEWYNTKIFGVWPTNRFCYKKVHGVKEQDTKCETDS